MAGSTILIDGYNLGLAKGTGVATYARNLSGELTAMGHGVEVLYGHEFGPSKEPLLREIAFFDNAADKSGPLKRAARDVRNAFSGKFTQVAEAVPLSGAVIATAFKAQLPQCRRILNAPDVFRRANGAFALGGGLTNVRLDRAPDLAHWTYPLPIRAGGCANLYTLHDLVPLRLPYTTLDRKKRYLGLMRELARRADHLVTVSESSRRDIISLLGVPEDRISNTYQSVAIPPQLLAKSEETIAREVEGASGMGYKDYFLFWGSIEPKKNIGRMIEAYLASGVSSPLLIIGAQAWKSEEELRLLEGAALRLDKRIIMLSYAPFSLLVSLIRGAKAALFPSLYEGFGLPALEAMLLGTPVIAANTASLPEVVGDAALSVDPYDTAALSEAIRTIDADADLRTELSRRGLAQAALFSPEIYRQRLKTVYDRFL